MIETWQIQFVVQQLSFVVVVVVVVVVLVL